MRLDVAKRLKLDILPNGQLALLADKVSQMKSLGEVNILVTENETGKVVLRLRALIVENLGVECYGGQTFHLDNGIVDDVSMKTISFHHGKHTIHQGHKYGQLVAHPPPYLTVESEVLEMAAIETKPNPPQEQPIDPAGTKTIAIKDSKTLLPAGLYAIEVENPPSNDHILVIPEPPKLVSEQSFHDLPAWPPQICSILIIFSITTKMSISEQFL